MTRRSFGATAGWRPAASSSSMNRRRPLWTPVSDLHGATLPAEAYSVKLRYTDDYWPAQPAPIRPSNKRYKSNARLAR